MATDKIEKVQDDIVIVTETTKANIATAQSGYTIEAATFSSWGKMAQLDLQVKSSSAGASGQKNVATLASGKRPIMATLCLTSTGNRVYIGTTGTVVVYQATAANETVYIRGVYMLS